MNKTDRVRQLQGVPLFAGCSRRQLAALEKSVRVEQLEAGHRMLNAGAPAPNMYILITGTADVRRRGRKVASIGPGEAIGELGVLLGEARNADVVASTPIEVLVLNRASLKKAMDDLPGFGWQLLQSVASRLAEESFRQT